MCANVIVPLQCRTCAFACCPFRSGVVACVYKMIQLQTKASQHSS